MSNLSPRKLQPLDRTAILILLILSIVIGGLLLLGDRASARVRSFSWAEQQVGATDAAFVMAFSRPMDHASVEQNLQIQPALNGKFSWAGRRMAYTLERPAPYGENFELKLEKARDRFSIDDQSLSQIQPFASSFRSRDRAFAYLGVQGEEAGRLILANLTQKKQEILTPENLVVMDFKIYPNGDRILFSATERSSKAKGQLDQQLYSASTGLLFADAPSLTGDSPKPPLQSPSPAGEITPILDSKTYQNLKFDLSPDGQTIAVQRVKRDSPGDLGLWIIKGDAAPQRVEAEAGGNFLIAPDSQSLAMSQGQGMAILPLDIQAQTLDFLPKYGVILSFAPDGSAAAFVKFNVDPQNPTRSLYLVTNQGLEQKLLTTNGSILKATFDPTQTMLYCLYSKRLAGETYQEQPYIAAIPLPPKGQSEASTQEPEWFDLLQLPVQRDIQISLAPDGLGILFDQIVSDNSQQTNALRGSDGKVITDSQLWFLPLTQDAEGLPTPAEPQPLALAGLRPQWLP